MKTLNLVLLLALTACNAPATSPTDTGPTSSQNSLGAASPVNATLDLTGRWRRVGTTCGTVYTPLSYTEYTDFSATEMSVSQYTTCAGAIIPIQYYELRYEVGAISVRLDRGFASCPSNYNSSPGSAFASKPVRVTIPNQAMEITEGLCNIPQGWHTISAYQKQ